MGIVFESVEMRQFMCFENVVFPFAERGLFFIQGRTQGQEEATNGVGKSAIIEALTFCLFGRTLRGMAADEVIRTTGSGGCWVCVLFKQGETRYSVLRVRNWVSSIGEPSVTGVFLERLSEPRADLSGSSVRETEKRICEILGFSYDIFKNSVTFGQGLPHRFVQASDNEKKEILDEILALGWTGDAWMRAKKLAKTYEELNSSIGMQIVTKQARINENRVFVQDLSCRIGGYEKRISEARDTPPRHWRIVKAREGVTAAEVLLSQALETQTEIHAKQASLDRDAGHLRDVLNTKRAKLANFISLIDLEKRNEAKLSEQCYSVQRMICPTCKRPIGRQLGAQLVAQFSQELAVVQANLLRFQSAIEDLNRAVDISSGHMIALREAIAEAQGAFDLMRSTLDERRETLRIKTLDLSRLEAEINEPVASLQRVRDDFLTMKLEREQQIEISEAEITSLNEDALLCQRISHEGLAFWEEGFSNRGIKSLVLSSVKPFLDEAAEIYSRLLTDGHLKITFHTQMMTQAGETREKFEVRVADVDSSVGYSQNSGGERRRVDVIVLLALHDLIIYQSGIDTSVQFFDEVFENLDEAGTDALLELLSQRGQDRAIYVITHDPGLQLASENVIMVEKQGDHSVILLGREAQEIIH
jgi:DNA repair exonuclease SbcCD ATPase subunit